MKTKFKNAKGITLIALVITIIVLLILAGVTIATLTGDNGILGKANDAKTQTEQAKEDENLKKAINEFLEGNTSSFDDIYKFSSKYVYTCISKIVKDEELIKDSKEMLSYEELSRLLSIFFMLIASIESSASSGLPRLSPLS